MIIVHTRALQHNDDRIRQSLRSRCRIESQILRPVQHHRRRSSSSSLFPVPMTSGDGYIGAMYALSNVHVADNSRTLNWLAPKPVFPSLGMLSFQERHQGLKNKRWNFRRSYKTLKTAVVLRPDRTSTCDRPSIHHGDRLALESHGLRSRDRLEDGVRYHHLPRGFKGVLPTRGNRHLHQHLRQHWES